MPEKHDENLRLTPRSPEDHNNNPRNKFEGVFDNPETPKKPFEQRLPDYVKKLKDLENALEKGKVYFFDYIQENPVMTLQEYLDVIKSNSDEISKLEIEFLKHPGSKEDLEDIIALINDSGDFRAAQVAIAHLRDFLIRN